MRLKFCAMLDIIDAPLVSLCGRYAVSSTVFRQPKRTFSDARPLSQTVASVGPQYFDAIGNSSAGNSEIKRQPLSVTTTSSSIRAAE